MRLTVWFTLSISHSFYQYSNSGLGVMPTQVGNLHGNMDFSTVLQAFFPCLLQLWNLCLWRGYLGTPVCSHGFSWRALIHFVVMKSHELIKRASHSFGSTTWSEYLESLSICGTHWRMFTTFRSLHCLELSLVQRILPDPTNLNDQMPSARACFCIECSRLPGSLLPRSLVYCVVKNPCHYFWQVLTREDT